jgi:prepilin-type N-terminal cleavage/methylation domain-containing protein
MSSPRPNWRRPANGFPPRGFTLIEMLLTLTIIIIMFTMMYGFGSRRNQMTKKQRCQANLQKAYLSLQIYANEHDGAFPVVTNAATSEEALAVLVPQYCADVSVFTCPGSKDKPLAPGTPLNKGKISYAYYMGRKQGGDPLPLLSDRQLNTDPKFMNDALFSPDGKKPANNHHKYGGVVLFTDGETRSVGNKLSFDLPVGEGVILLNPKP